MKNIVAVVGSYRKGGITDQTVDAVLAAAREHGATTEMIRLTDKHIEFCTNCRACMQDMPEAGRGKCVHKDDMDAILDAVDAADAVILASPVNFGTVTALMKRFVERCGVYGYWPWGRPSPRSRERKGRKKALVTTSSACPALIAKIAMRSAPQVMTQCAAAFGAKPVRHLYFGMMSREKEQKLSRSQLEEARAAGAFLSES